MLVLGKRVKIMLLLHNPRHNEHWLADGMVNYLATVNISKVLESKSLVLVYAWFRFYISGDGASTPSVDDAASY